MPPAAQRKQIRPLPPNGPAAAEIAMTPRPDPDHPSRVSVAVIGCGRMGRLHARVYSQMPNVRLVGVYDARPTAAESTAKEYGAKAFADLEELLPIIKAATIAVPTQFHLAVAEPLLARGIACRVDKPRARDVAECQRIVDAAQKSGATVQVGHIERFNPAVVALRKLDLRPRYIEAIRVSPMPFRSLDVGVVLDVMIHDLDIILSLARSKPVQVDANGVSVIGSHEDVCSARITFENGCVANVTASRLALKTERKLRVFCHDSFVSIDYQKKTGVIARRSGNVDAIRAAVNKV